MKKLHFDQEDHLDLSERYLWALSMSAHPNSEILKDLLDRHRKNDNYPEKVKETLVLTLAQMAQATRANPQEHKVCFFIETFFFYFSIFFASRLFKTLKKLSSTT